MRISAIAPVGSTTAAPVDPVHWQESRRVQATRAREASGPSFDSVLEGLCERPHYRRTRVIEVVFAQGVRPGMIRTRDSYKDDSNQ